MFTYLISLFAVAVVHSSEYQLECNDAFDADCYRKSLILNSTNSIVYCRGYSSCREAKDVIVYGGDTDSSTYDKQFIYCYGGLSCSNVSSLVAVNYENKDVHGKIICFGYESCIYSTIQSQDNIDCYGQRSCMNTIITIHEDSSDELELECTGELSCINSRITNVNVVEGTGSYSLYNSIIEHDANSANSTMDGTELEILLFGYYAGYNASIYCNNIETCTLYCFGNSCYKTKFYCNSEVSQCNLFCDDSINNICPLNCSNPGECDDTAAEDNPVATELLSYIETQQTQSSVIACDDTSTAATGLDITLCDDYKQCFDLNETFTLDYSNLCCRGSLSCAISWRFGVVSTLTTETETETETATQDSNRYNSMFCDGYMSCSQAFITNVVSGSEDVYTKIHCVGGNSCLRLNFTGTGSDDKSVLECVGQGACQIAEARYIKKVECSAKNACVYGVFSSVSTIAANGLYGFMYATASSNGNNLNISFNSYWAGYGSSIYCNEGDTCWVNCNTHEACTQVTVYCPQGSNCQVSCDESAGLTCPQIVNGTITTTVATNVVAENGTGNKHLHEDLLDYLKDNSWILITTAAVLSILIIACVVCFVRTRRSKNRLNQNWTEVMREDIDQADMHMDHAGMDHEDVEQ